MGRAPVLCADMAFGATMNVIHKPVSLVYTCMLLCFMLAQVALLGSELLM